MMSDASSEDDGGVGARRKSHKRGRKRKPASDEVLLESVLMGYLIQQFCWGFYSASEIQRLASFLKQDLQAAKAAGEDGTFPQVDKAAAYVGQWAVSWKYASGLDQFIGRNSVEHAASHSIVP